MLIFKTFLDHSNRNSKQKQKQMLMVRASTTGDISMTRTFKETHKLRKGMLQKRAEIRKAPDLIIDKVHVVSPSCGTSGEGRVQHLQESGPIGMHSLPQSTHGYFHPSLAKRWKQCPISYKHLQLLWHGSPSLPHNDKWKSRAHTQKNCWKWHNLYLAVCRVKCFAFSWKKRKKNPKPNGWLLQSYSDMWVQSCHYMSNTQLQEHAPLPPCFVLPHFKGKQTLLNPSLEDELGKFHWCCHLQTNNISIIYKGKEISQVEILCRLHWTVWVLHLLWLGEG